MRYLLNGSVNGYVAWVSCPDDNTEPPERPKCCRKHNKTPYWFGYLTIIKCPICKNEGCAKASDCELRCPYET